LEASSTKGAILCNGGTTTVTVSANGGTAPYTGTGDFTVSAGDYSYTVTDANGCTSTTSGSVSQPTALAASSTKGAILCNGGTTTVTVSANGGTAPYTGTGDFTVRAGDYSYTVTDANGCTSTTSGSVSQPTVLEASSTKGAILCNGGTTTVTVSANGGTAPYTGTGDFTVSAGDYSYTVTDANGCTSTTSGSVSQPTAISPSIAQQTNVSCNGESNGSATVTATGGTGAYTYSWSPSGGTAASASGLKAGIYTVTITDANSCAKNVTVTITQPEVLAVSISKTDLICSYDLGTATANVTGGTAPYTYVWKSIAKERDGDDDDHKTTPNQTTQTASFKTGTWSVTVTDAHGCTVSNNVTIILLSFTTVTPVGYSAKSEGNNWGRNYLVANFASKFPNGLTVGGTKTLKFNSAAAIQAFLPSDGAAKALTSNLVNPTSKTYSNALASQTVALTLTLAFDADSNFSSSFISLGSRVIRSGAFAGKTVNDLLAIANTVLGGGSSSYNPAQISSALDAINKSYDKNEKHDDEDSKNSGYLTSLCSNSDKSNDSDKNGESELSCLEKSFVLYPNPATEKSNLDFTLKNDSPVKIELYNKYGQYVGKIYDGVAKAGKANSIYINAGSLSSDVYIMLIYTNKGVINKRIVVTK
jgi:hypothetical protein